jgi:hypothetical protein
VQKCDTPVSGDIMDSRTDSEGEEEEVVEWVSCDGFTDEQGQKKCKIGNNRNLDDTAKNDYFKVCLIYKVAAANQTKHFCKASHFICYLLKYHTQKPGNKSIKKTTKTTTSTPLISTTTTSTAPLPLNDTDTQDTQDTPQTTDEQQNTPQTSTTTTRSRAHRGAQESGGHGERGCGGCGGNISN